MSTDQLTLGEIEPAADDADSDPAGDADPDDDTDAAPSWTPGTHGGGQTPTCQCGAALAEVGPSVGMAREIARVYADGDGVVPACPACTDAQTIAMAVSRVPDRGPSDAIWEGERQR